MKELWLARHGETEWTRARRHTSITDVALTPKGIEQAIALGQRLKDIPFELVLTSPSIRARSTAEAAGFQEVETSEHLLELDYGKYEGITSADIVRERPGWNLWRDGCPDGETPADVAVRTDRVLERVLPVAGRVLIVGHGHTSRVLAARFIGLAGEAGGLFAFDVAALSVLGYEHDRPVMVNWNQASTAR